MATASEVAVRYSARGAKTVQRADRKVRESIQTTADTAREESGTISRWMQRHKSALLAIGATTTAVMAGIIRSSPALSAVLSEVRLGFSLLAQEIGQDVAPTMRGLGDLAIQAADAYGDLPDPVRNATSHLIVFGGAGVIAATALGGITQLLTGQALIPALQSLATWLSAGSVGAVALAAAVGLLIGLTITWGLEMLGVLDAVQDLGNWVGNRLPDRARDGVMTIIGLFTGPWAVIGAFIVGTIEGGFQQGFARAEQVMRSFVGAADRFLGPIDDTVIDITRGLRNLGEGGWNIAIKFVDDPLGTTEDILGSLRNIAENRWNTVLEITQQLVPGGIQSAVGDARNFADPTRGWKFTGFQSGGIVTERTAAIIGEAGEDEAVAPLSDLSSMIRSAVRAEGGGGDTKIINVTLERGAVQLRGTPAGGEVDESEMAEEIGQVFDERTSGRGHM